MQQAVCAFSGALEIERFFLEQKCRISLISGVKASIIGPYNTTFFAILDIIFERP